MLSLVLTANAAFAQSNENFQRVAPPENAKEIVKQMDNTKAPAKAEGQEVVLQPQSEVSAALVRNEDLPLEKRPRIRKGFDMKTKQVTFREVVTLEQLEARKQANKEREQRVTAPATKE